MSPARPCRTGGIIYVENLPMQDAPKRYIVFGAARRTAARCRTGGEYDAGFLTVSMLSVEEAAFWQGRDTT